jgi:serine phosphatase RsbU (regulator of sigma subunit)
MFKRQSATLARQLDEHYAAEARNLRKLADAALVLNSTLALDEILGVLTSSAREVIGAHQAETILVADAEAEGRGGETLSRSHSPKYDAWAEEGRHIDFSPVHDLVWERLQPVRMTKREIEQSFESRGLFDVGLGHPMLEGWLAVPIISRTGRTFGLLQVADKEGGDFNDSDEVVLLQLAQLAAVAIENAERFEQEHLIAETLQRSLLPEAMPSISGVELAARYQPGGAGAQVGGDWYDVLELDDGSVVLAVGDVAGRGARAAAVMGQLRTAMRAYAIQGLPPAELMTSLDRLLQGLSPTEMATAVYLVLSKDRRSIEGVCAGHPPPIMSCGPDGTCTYIRFDPHPPLGVLEQPRYRSLTVDVVSGSLLLLYTDGLVEERHASLDDGLNRLADVIDPLEPSLEQVCSDVLTTMVPGEKNDDIALLAVRIIHD